MDKAKHLLEYSLEELQTLMVDWGQPRYRAKQILQGYYRRLSLASIPGVPKELLAKLESFSAPALEIVERFTSKDGTVKYLYRLWDGNVVEGVLMKYQYGNTLCVSTQVGCRMGCAFCASTLDGLVRNLSAGEILGQVLAANAENGGDLKKRFITNVVLMGSGEPLDNFDEVVRFLRLVNAEEGLGISMRNISVSTCGLVPEIKHLADLNLGVTLSISLHAARDDVRRGIMPIAKRYELSELLGAAHEYYERTGRRVIFEYAVIDGVNMRDADALAALVRGFPCHVNLILLNPVKERALYAPSKGDVYRFMERLQALGVSVSLRRQMGVDIDGACGQLRRKYLERASDK